MKYLALLLSLVFCATAASAQVEYYPQGVGANSKTETPYFHKINTADTCANFSAADADTAKYFWGGGFEYDRTSGNETCTLPIPQQGHQVFIYPSDSGSPSGALTIAPATGDFFGGAATEETVDATLSCDKDQLCSITLEAANVGWTIVSCEGRWTASTGPGIMCHRARTYGEMFQEDDPACGNLVDVTVAGTHVTVDGMGAGDISNVTFASDTLTIGSEGDGIFVVNGSGSFLGAASQDYEFCAGVGGTAQSECCVDSSFGGAAQVRSFSFSCLLDLNSADAITMTVTNQGTGAADPTFCDANLNIIRAD